MNRTILCSLSALLSLAFVERAQSEPSTRTQVSELKALLIRAIEHGDAHGVLVGPGPAYLRRIFDTSASVEIDVHALHALPQPGCHRLQVTTRQRDALERSTRSDKELVYQLNYCRDGRFPEKS